MAKDWKNNLQDQFGAYVGYPGAPKKEKRREGAVTGFLAAVSGLPKDESKLLGKDDLDYLKGYEAGEPVGIALGALPLAIGATGRLSKASRQAAHETRFENLTKGYKDEGQFRRIPGISANNEGFGFQSKTGPEGLQTSFERRKYGEPQGSGAFNGAEQNKAIQIAKEANLDFDLNKIKNMPESSIRKQHPIAKAYDVLSQENVNPALKQAIFEDYKAKHPKLIEQHNIQNYDDLVHKSYGALRSEVNHQFDSLVKKGVSFDFHQGNANYANSREMLDDALNKNHMYVFRGGEEHPHLNEFDPHYGLNTNEKFRAVHDYIGHGTTGSTFGRKGEELAYGAHKETLSPLAQIAAAAETRGQNSFVNYSGINADLEQKMAHTRLEKMAAQKAGEDVSMYDAKLRELGNEWQYAKQTGLALPPDMLQLEYKGKVPEYLKEHIYPKNPENINAYHWSFNPDLKETDVKKYGFGIKGQEAERLRYPGAVKERSYYYTDPVLKEPGLGPNQYQSNIQSSYNINEDPDKLLKIADNFNRDKFGILDIPSKANDWERMIKEAGYSGYHDPSANVAVSFKNQPVSKILDTNQQ